MNFQRHVAQVETETGPSLPPPYDQDSVDRQCKPRPLARKSNVHLLFWVGNMFFFEPGDYNLDKAASIGSMGSERNLTHAPRHPPEPGLPRRNRRPRVA